MKVLWDIQEDDQNNAFLIKNMWKRTDVKADVHNNQSNKTELKIS